MGDLKVDDYYMMSKQVAEDLSENLRRYSDYIKDTPELRGELFRTLEAWLRTADVYRSSHYDENDVLVNVLWYINAVNSSKASVSVNRKLFREQRRHRRIYLGKVFEKDLVSGSSLVQKACDEYFAVLGGSKENRFPNKQAYIDDCILRTRHWASDVTADLIDYPLFNYLKPSKRVQDYITDLAWHLFAIIIDRYNSNPVSGMVTSFPRNMIDSAVFAGSTKGQKANVSMEYSKDMVSAIERRSIKHPDGSRVSTKYVAESVEGDFPEDISSNKEVQEGVLANLREKGKMFDIQNSLLDARDRTLFTVIYNSFTMEDISSGRKVMPLIDILRALNMPAQQKSYSYVLKRIDKMLRYRMDYTTYAENGTDIRETGSMVLFSRVGYQMPDKDGGTGTTTFSMNDSTTPASYLDVLENADLKNAMVAVEPSPFLKEVMIKNATVNVLTKEYLRVIPDKIKSFLMLLQEERMRVHPERRITPEYKFFSERLRFDNLRPYELKSQVKEALEYLKSEKIIVQDYTTGPYSVIIDFSPFTETERMLCRLDQSKDTVI